jgi:hypothetical protein
MSSLVDLATEDLNLYTTSTATNVPLLVAAKADLDAQQVAVDTATKDLGQGLEQLAPLRAQLAASPMPADALGLAADFETLIATTRGLQAALIAAQKLEEQDEAELTYLKDVVDRATRKTAVAQAALDAANADATKRANWVTALGVPPLATLPADAQAAVAGVGATAQTRLAHDLPAELLQLATSRHGRERDRQQRVQTASEHADDKVVARVAQDGGVAGLLAQTSRAYGVAENAFAAYVVTGRESYDRAVAALNALNASPALSADELARMTLADIHDPGVTAAGVIGPLEVDLAAIDDKRQHYDDAVFDALGVDPDVDLTTVGTVTAALGALHDAANDLATALGALTDPPLTDAEKTARDAWGNPAVPATMPDLETMIATMVTATAASTADQRAALTAWEATVPDGTWDSLGSYLDAIADLNALATIDLATLQGDLTGAETALHDALVAASKSERAQWEIQEEAKKRAALLAAESASGQVRMVSATRGDG